MTEPARMHDEIAPLMASLDLSPDPVFVTDRHNRIVCWNRSIERILGFTAEEAIGASCADLLRGTDLFGNRYCSESCPICQMAARGESVRRFKVSFACKDGEAITADVSILTFTVSAPPRFFLAHILTVLPGVGAPKPQVQPEDDPPRAPVVTARESTDVRARRLTAREVEVLGMLAGGRATPEIAQRLNISNLTVRNHIQNILDKLEVHSKAEAVAFAFQKRLI